MIWLRYGCLMNLEMFYRSTFGAAGGLGAGAGVREGVGAGAAGFGSRSGPVFSRPVPGSPPRSDAGGSVTGGAGGGGGGSSTVGKF